MARGLRIQQGKKTVEGSHLEKKHQGNRSGIEPDVKDKGGIGRHKYEKEQCELCAEQSAGQQERDADGSCGEEDDRQTDAFGSHAEERKEGSIHE